MSKGLEAIERYKKVVCPNCQYNYGDGCQNKDQCFSMIIERELKALEIIKKHLKIVIPINDTIEIFDIDLWNDGKQKEEFNFVKETLFL